LKRGDLPVQACAVGDRSVRPFPNAGELHCVFDDIPITAIITMESVGTGTRYVFTALHRNEADLETNKASGFYQGTEIAVDQFVARVKSMR
jgi:hypothetical protein